MYTIFECGMETTVENTLHAYLVDKSTYLSIKESNSSIMEEVDK